MSLGTEWTAPRGGVTINELHAALALHIREEQVREGKLLDAERLLEHQVIRGLGERRTSLRLTIFPFDPYDGERIEHDLIQMTKRGELPVN